MRARSFALCAVLLASPSLFIGFQLDDYVGRYIYSTLDGATHLYKVYSAGYGFANGDPVDNHWQIEEGYAPWWMHPQLRLSFFRPLSSATHLFDAQLWPDTPWLMHAHSLLWLALLVLAAARLYRGMLEPAAAALATLLVALDHTHGFAVGFIVNRHALITAVFGVLCLDRHHRERRDWLAPALYLLTLLAGESGIAIAGYVFAYALFVERGTWQTRALGLAPYALITIVWRVGYDLSGHGGFGSGLYVDPAREPLSFALAVLRRAPIQWLGQLFLPPAELYWTYSKGMIHAVWLFAVAFGALFTVALWPLLRVDRIARFWALGFALSIVPACAGYPSGRQLLLSGIGAMPLLAQLWDFHTMALRSRARSGLETFSAAVSGAVLAVHVLVSPFASPIASCGVALSAPLARAADDLGPEIAGKDVVLLTSPDYFAARLAPLRKRIEHKPLPRRWRALAFGAEPVRVTRAAADILVVDYGGKLLADEALEFYRDRHARMAVGEHVRLEGLDIEVLAVTADGLADRVSFHFDDAPTLDATQFQFYAWRDNGYAKLTLPAVGSSVLLPAAELHLSL